MQARGFRPSRKITPPTRAFSAGRGLEVQSQGFWSGRSQNDKACYENGEADPRGQPAGGAQDEGDPPPGGPRPVGGGCLPGPGKGPPPQGGRKRASRFAVGLGLTDPTEPL